MHCIPLPLQGRGTILISFCISLLVCGGFSFSHAADTASVAPDSLADTSSAVRDMVKESLKAPAQPQAKWSREIQAALLWSIYDLPQIKDWQGAVNANLRADSVRFDRGFESFNNGFSPALGIALRSPKGRLNAELQAQLLWLSKRVSYSSLQDDSTRISGHEAIRLRSIPLVLGISTEIPESLFTVQGFERVEVGLCAVAVPLAWLNVDGTREQSFTATGHGFGFGLRLGIGKKISPRFLYRGELRYFSTTLSSFDREDGGRLLESQLAGGTGSEAFSLDEQILQFQIQIVFGDFGADRAPKRVVP